MQLMFAVLAKSSFPPVRVAENSLLSRFFAQTQVFPVSLSSFSLSRQMYNRDGVRAPAF